MKKYVKPTFEAVELRLEERIARCYNQPKPKKSHGGPNCGDHPGRREHCPSGS
ncbi:MULTISPECIES: hypothetical protein [Clostridium]|uniref:hypothetical protein n=1 Tax=Clostridium TaxID=1485 RepID=UPI00136B07C5|nr:MULTISPECIES: hypothetical protein [Clostridium]